MYVNAVMALSVPARCAPYYPKCQQDRSHGDVQLTSKRKHTFPSTDSSESHGTPTSYLLAPRIAGGCDNFASVKAVRIANAIRFKSDRNHSHCDDGERESRLVQMIRRGEFQMIFDSPHCRGQAPPPPGDDCSKELDWWFSKRRVSRNRHHPENRCGLPTCRRPVPSARRCGDWTNASVLGAPQ